MHILFHMIRDEWRTILRDEREAQLFFVKVVVIFAYFGIAMYSLKFR